MDLFWKKRRGGRIMNIDDKVITPTACALYPKEFLSYLQGHMLKECIISYNGLRCLWWALCCYGRTKTYAK